MLLVLLERLFLWKSYFYAGLFNKNMTYFSPTYPQ